MYTDDCLYEDLAIGKVTHGKKELTEFVNYIFTSYPDFHIESKSSIISDNWAAIEGVISGTQKHSSVPNRPVTGKTFSVRYVSILETREGKINRESDYYNALTILMQLGLMAAPPSR